MTEYVLLWNYDHRHESDDLEHDQRAEEDFYYEKSNETNDDSGIESGCYAGSRWVQ